MKIASCISKAKGLSEKLKCQVLNYWKNSCKVAYCHMVFQLVQVVFITLIMLFVSLLYVFYISYKRHPQINATPKAQKI